jgi:ABC-type anion transport system duplicated permease subunit
MRQTLMIICAVAVIAFFGVAVACAVSSIPGLIGVLSVWLTLFFHRVADELAKEPKDGCEG